MATRQPSETGRVTRPDAPPPEETDPGQGGPPARDEGGEDAPPVATAGSEATSTVARGAGRETGEAQEQRGDAVDGSEGSATGSRTGRPGR